MKINNKRAQTSHADVVYHRLFLGCELSQDDKAKLLNVQKQLQGEWEDFSLRWVSPEKLHLTLHFMAEVSESKLDSLIVSLNNVKGAAFEQVFDEVFCFPSAINPQVFGVGGKTIEAALMELYDALSQTLVQHGITVEKRRFYPHLTLARTSKEGSFSVEPTPSISPILFKFNQFSLFKSLLGSQGAKYQILKTFSLG